MGQDGCGRVRETVIAVIMYQGEQEIVRSRKERTLPKKEQLK